MQFSDPNLPPIFNAIFEAHFGHKYDGLMMKRLDATVAEIQDRKEECPDCDRGAVTTNGTTLQACETCKGTGRKS